MSYLRPLVDQFLGKNDRNVGASPMEHQEHVREESAVGMVYQVDARSQGFYLSDLFAELQIETRDYREHPVLGGISSTRWNAYETFVVQNSKIVDILQQLPAFSYVVSTRASGDSAPKPPPDLFKQLVTVSGPDAKLVESGLLSGDQRSNCLLGSSKRDVLIGWSGRDRLEGGLADDVLSGGRGRDRFVFRAGLGNRDQESSYQTDVITDFDGSRGDRLVFPGVKVKVSKSGFTGRSGEVTYGVWMARLAYVPDQDTYPWMMQGTHLWVDWDGDKNADLMIDLPGVAAFSPSWLSME
ncbi:MAG: hypothetical protein ACO3QB_13930 [bacterium]